LSYFRSTKPNLHLEKLYPDEFHVDIEYEPKLHDDDWLKQYDLIHYHRALGNYDQMEGLLEKLKSLGIPTVMDLDDYWLPDMTHPAYHIIKNNDLDKKILNNLKIAENIITTTEIFANEIKKHNKNVVVLPNAIDPTEKQYTSNPEPSDKIRIGWLGGSCMTPDTEILTDGGWKRFDELDKTEKVVTLNPETNYLEYHKPSGYICEPFDGELNCAKNGLIEYEVTPNHNMYASEAKNLTHKKLNLGLVQSEKIYGKNFHVRKNANWIGNEVEYFILPNLASYTELKFEFEEAYNENFIKGHKKNKYGVDLYEKYGTDTMIEMNDWLEFFGFWMAEGWTSKSKGLHQVGIAQSKDNHYLEHMFNLLTKMGFNPKYTKDKKQLRVFDKQLWNYLSDFGTATEKFIPKEILNLSSRQLKIFLEWFINGDGHIENNKYGRTRAFTSSSALANDLQEMALKLGISATITNRGKRTSMIKGRKITNQFDSLVVNFTKHPSVSKHNKNTPLIKTDDQYKKYYKGNVYCVEVQNHIIYIRRNGKAFWIGNSHLADLKLLNQLVSKLKGDGLLDKIQFVLCGFDTRGKVNSINKDTGEQTQRDILPHETVWCEYEKIFTNDYTTISKEYKEHLLRYVTEEFPSIMQEPYRRVWTKPITNYATNYNLFDISLAPLTEHTFNKVKSQLKVIESGFHKKALIAQNYGPYTIDIQNAFQKGGEIDLTKNGLLVDSHRNHKQWYQYLKKLIQNPEMIKILGDNLYNTVAETYSMDKVTENRAKYYKKLVFGTEK